MLKVCQNDHKEDVLRVGSHCKKAHQIKLKLKISALSEQACWSQKSL